MNSDTPTSGVTLDVCPNTARPTTAPAAPPYPTNRQSVDDDILGLAEELGVDAGIEAIERKGATLDRLDMFARRQLRRELEQGRTQSRAERFDPIVTRYAAIVGHYLRYALGLTSADAWRRACAEHNVEPADFLSYQARLATRKVHELQRAVVDGAVDHGRDRQLFVLEAVARRSTAAVIAVDEDLTALREKFDAVAAAARSLLSNPEMPESMRIELVIIRDVAEWHGGPK